MKKPHKDLDVWRISIELVSRIYELTERFPNVEKFGLTAQTRRSAVSVASNIAEGAARGSDNDFVRFLKMSRGSLSELDTQLEIARNLDFLNETQHQTIDDLMVRNDKLLAGLIRHLENT